MSKKLRPATISREIRIASEEYNEYLFRRRRHTQKFIDLNRLGEKWDRTIINHARLHGVEQTSKEFGVSRETVIAVRGRA